jgi:tetratricopeptide (TPR) repeat protein
MFPATSGRRLLILAIALLAAVVIATPSFAQPTGLLKGKVVDAAKKPVEGAKVVIEFQGGITRKYEVPTNKKGEYTQVGLQPGGYKVTVTKDALTVSKDVRVRLGDPTDLDFDLVPGAAGGGVSKEDLARVEGASKAFEAGTAATAAGNFDEAIAKFTEAAQIAVATQKDGTKKEVCYECYYNVGYAYAQKKEYDKAEEAYNKALALKMDYADAYNGLASLYNNQGKIEQARAAAKKAAELQAAAAGGTAPALNADDLYNKAVFDWNANNFDEAKASFDEVLKMNPNHADAHFMVGMWLVRNGKMPEAVVEFETYLKLAPGGKRAAEAKNYVDALKKK